MPASEITYAKGRAIARALQFCGWLVTLSGIAVAGTGMWSVVAPLPGIEQTGLPGSLMVVTFGIVIAIAGVIALQQAHTAQATFQMSQDMRALLQLHRKTAAPGANVLRAEPSLTSARRR